MSDSRAPSPSLARLERALRTCARIVAAPGGEVYVPIFERLEAEIAAHAQHPSHTPPVIIWPPAPPCHVDVLP